MDGLGAYQALRLASPSGRGFCPLSIGDGAGLPIAVSSWRLASASFVSLEITCPAGRRGFSFASEPSVGSIVRLTGKGCCRTGGVMDAINFANETTRTVVNRALEAFLSDAPIQQRLAEANGYVRSLEKHSGTAISELRELKSLADDLALWEGQGWNEEHEFELTERVLALYADMAGGALIF
jgi:hypothetical protein